MDPISSSVPRSSNLQATLPAQQKRDEDAISAPQARTESLSPTVPGRDLQLQRRQVVEELGKNQSAQAELRKAGDQLEQGKTLADNAAKTATSDTERKQLQEAFAKVSSNLNALADKAEQSNSKTLDANSLRVTSGIESSATANTTATSLGQSLEQVQSGLDSLSSQEQTLGSSFPRSANNGESGPPLQSREQADQIARQTQSRIRQDNSGALAAQANVNPQTALTLFQ